MRGDGQPASPATIDDLERWVREAGWQDPSSTVRHHDYVALVVRRRWHCLVLPDRVATFERLWRTNTAGLAIVQDAAGVADALAAFGLLPAAETNTMSEV